jgi:CheY-like chemotaxis protein
VTTSRLRPDHPVLLVTPEPDMQATYARFLRRRGLSTRAVATEREALAVLRDSRLGAVLSAMRLRDGTALAIARAACAARPPIPAIVVTGHVSAPERADVLAAGATAYVGTAAGLTGLAAVLDEITPAPARPRPPGLAKRPSPSRPHHAR